ncbi:MAG: RimK/LysX family protein [Oceanipulchritudo sp.]
MKASAKKAAPAGSGRTRSGLPVIGWREWVSLPEFGVDWIKAKVDTGARSSALHAFGLRRFQREGLEWVRFQIHPVQRKNVPIVEAEAKILEWRSVRNSSGRATIRPVILTNLIVKGRSWPIELTLASRDEMGFRMLLGREAVRRRFLVDSGKSYYAGKPPRKAKAGPV